MSTAVHIGSLRHRLTIQVNTPSYAATGTTDSWAAVSDAYSDGGVVSANVEELSGSEAIIAHQVDSRAAYKITVRYNSSLTLKHRFLWGSRIFHPTRLRNINQRNAVQVVEAWEEVV